MSRQHPSDRGTGRTTKQIKDAPQGAVFFWCNDHTHYPRDLARSLGRTDLSIEPASALDSPHRFLGRKVSAYILDHAFTWAEPRHHRTGQRVQAFYDLTERLPT